MNSKSFNSIDFEFWNLECGTMEGKLTTTLSLIYGCPLSVTLPVEKSTDRKSRTGKQDWRKENQAVPRKKYKSQVMDAMQVALPILGIAAAAAVTFYAVSFSEIREVTNSPTRSRLQLSYVHSLTASLPIITVLRSPSGI